MFQFRFAHTADAKALSAIAYNAEKFLGYDTDYMTKFSDLYNVSPDFISSEAIRIMEDDGCIVGFWGLSVHDKCNELCFFYIAPEFIGKGYGRLLWDDLISECRKSGVMEFNLITSPQSAPFYEKMGAITTGQAESLLIEGRMIPVLSYKVKDE